jgi:hypothetical protein
MSKDASVVGVTLPRDDSDGISELASARITFTTSPRCMNRLRADVVGDKRRRATGRDHVTVRSRLE